MWFPSQSVLLILSDKTRLHNQLEGVEDDHAGLVREDPLYVGVALGVGRAGQRPSTRAGPGPGVALPPAAADGGLPAEGEGVTEPGLGRLEERRRRLVPPPPVGVRNGGRRRRPL